MVARRTRGFSLIETMVVVGIVGMLVGGSVYGLRALTKSELRGSAAKLAGGIRYCFDRAVTTGGYYRLVLDLDGNKYWVEKSDNRMYLTREKERSPGQGKAYDYEAEERAREEAEAEAKERFTQRGAGLGSALEPPPAPRRAKFATFKDATLNQVKLKKTQLFDVYTARQREPYTAGRAYLYFFPDGHTERAIIRLKDGESWYSLVVHPLTGRVEVKSGKVDIPRDFDEPHS